jgi:8-amino-7-oxononanoate synthase
MSSHLDHLPGSFFGPSNLVDLLRHRASHQGGDTAFMFLPDGDGAELMVTHEQLDRQARAIASMLQSMDLKGERALLLYPAGLDFIAAFFGCLYAGVIAVPAYPPRRNRNMSRVEAIADDAEAKVALTTQGVLERVQMVIHDTRDLKQLHWLATDRLPDGLEAEWQNPDVHGDTMAFLQYTSGSTGTPKGVILNHANLMHNSAMISYAFEHTRSGMGVFWLPSYHDMGLIGGILQPLYVGRPNVLFPPTSFLQKPYRWLRAITRYGGTISGGPNFAYDLCVEKISDEQKAKLDLQTWSLAFNGAEPIRSGTIDRFVAAFEPCGFRREAFYPCYGLAEATLMVSGGFKTAAPIIRDFESDSLEHNQVVEALPDEEGGCELVGNGGNLLDQEILVADPDTLTRCPDNRVGEIWVRGPSVALGYWKRAEETAMTFDAHLADTGAGPYLRTGDLGFLADGELFVTGRIKDLIIIRGVNHYPQDIEQTVEQCHADLRPAAGAAVVVAEDAAERLVIVQETARRRDLDFEEIMSAIRRSVASQHDLAVEAIVLVKAGRIPKTSSGKIQRHACRAGFLGGTLPAVAQWRAGPSALPSTDSGLPGDTIAPRAATTASKGTASHAATEEPTGDRTTEIIFQFVRDVAGLRAQQLTLETNILELGLDSLERMEIIAMIQEAFGGRFPEEILPDMETCGQVVDAVHKYLGSAPVGDLPGRKALGTQEAAVTEEAYVFAKFPEYQRLKENFELLEQTSMPNPYFHVHQSVTNDMTRVDGRDLINFSSFNYLGMSGDPVVSQAAKQAINQYGTSVSASRLVSGETTVHRDLERAVADFLGVEDSIVFVGGHATNESTIGHLFGPGDLILHDGLAHNSIVQGSRLSGARRQPFPHNDWQACDQLLTQCRGDYRRVLIAIEGVYSMDGDFPDLPQFVAIKNRHKALLIVDEAHSLGTMGLHGRGICEHFHLDPREVDLGMGTLSKSLGSLGGYIAGCKEVVEYLKYTAPGFVFATGLAPASAAAALAALRLLEEEPERVAKLTDNAALFLRLAKERGLNTGLSDGTPVVPIIIGNSQQALILSHRMFERGINVRPILHPAVEEAAARLRFFISSSHCEDQIRAAVDAVAEEIEQVMPGTVKPKPSAKPQPQRRTHPARPR